MIWVLLDPERMRQCLMSISIDMDLGQCVTHSEASHQASTAYYMSDQIGSCGILAVPIQSDCAKLGGAHRRPVHVLSTCFLRNPPLSHNLPCKICRASFRIFIQPVLTGFVAEESLRYPT